MLEKYNIYSNEKNKYIGKETLSNYSLYTPSSKSVLNYIKKSYYYKQFTNRGPLVKDLEDKLLRFHNTKYCITFCNEFWALVAAIKNIAIKNRKYILMPSLSYKRVFDAVLWSGFTPLYGDIDSITLGLDIQSIDNKNLRNIALIVASHSYVDCTNVNPILKFSVSASIPVVFDSVESVNERLPQGRVGGFGKCEIFSLHANKLINGVEGGYITTNDRILYEEFKKFQNFSINSKGEITQKYAMNAKLNEGHAAFALASFDDLDLLIKHNYSIYKEYLSSEKLVSKKMRIRRYDNKIRPSYRIIVAELEGKYIDCRDELIMILKSIDILADTYYFAPLNEKVKSINGTTNNKLNYAEIYSKNLLTLPSGWHIRKTQISPIMCLISRILDDIYNNKNGL